LKKDQSFLLSTINDDKNIGVMEFVPAKERKQIYREIEQTRITENDKAIYFKNGIPCNVKFRNWTSKGKLRILQLTVG
jgi:ATP-dependent DNA ligase